MQRLRWILAFVFTIGTGALGSTTSTVPTSDAFRAANPDMLSGGVYAAMAADGIFGNGAHVSALRADTTDLSKGRPRIVLDARVGPNMRLGDDPAALQVAQLGQAEPHIFRSAANPKLLLATFQEGRFTDAGSLDCGYAVSSDGGFTWTRGLIPQLTTTSGGPYNRATDPVAAIGPQGDLYLNTLGSVSGAFATAAVLVSRSTDNGATWAAPVVVTQAASSQASPDKNWIAVNDFPGTANVGRLIVTWTNFTSTSGGASTGNNLQASVSDDRGATWSPPITVTPAGSTNQGSQPVFLPDGSLLLVYITFTNPSSTAQFSIECKRSLDGGRTFPATPTPIVAAVAGWDDPVMRDGVFLPSVAVARQSGDVFLTYTAVVSGTPRVLVVKSTDSGTTWGTPAIVSDNPAGVSVFNPAIAVSTDGRSVTAVFHDKRNASDARNFVDTYAAISVDGGSTWLPNVRLSDMTSDVRNAVSTARGYMIGDYQAVAPPSGSEPCVAIWCETRTGDTDPFIARFVPAASESIETWRQAYGTAGTLLADDDGDGVPNDLEYRLGTNPRVAETGESFFVRQVTAGVFDVAWAERSGWAGVSTKVVFNPTGGVVDTGLGGGVPLSADQLPAVALPGNLKWAGMRYTQSPTAPFSVGHAIQYSAGLPAAVVGTLTTANTNARLTNVSTRGFAGTGSGQMIVGFVIDGPKSLLVRAAGPALTGFGVPAVLPSPQLTLAPSGVTSSSTATNATLQQSAATSARLGAFPADAALLLMLPAGSYTAITSSAAGATGTALVEAYDADATPGAPTGPRLLNLSTRATAGASNALVAGFVIGGTQPRRVLVRAVGPTLATFGVSGTAPDPQLTITTSTGTVVAANDDWEISRSSAAIAATAQRLGAFPLIGGSLDAAVLLTLAPGAYTATVSSAKGGGVALVEVYDAD